MTEVSVTEQFEVKVTLMSSMINKKKTMLGPTANCGNSIQILVIKWE